MALIEADEQATLLALFHQAMKETGLESIEEVHRCVRALAQSDYDTLQTGNVFEDWSRAHLFVKDDFTTLLVRVPPPDARVDLLRALLEYREDSRNAEYAESRDLTIEQAWMIFLNAWDWSRFWATRHRFAEARARFAQRLAWFEAEGARIGEKTRARLARASIFSIEGRA